MLTEAGPDMRVGTLLADLNNDGVIDIQDVALVAFYYGTHA